MTIFIVHIYCYLVYDTKLRVCVKHTLKYSIKFISKIIITTIIDPVIKMPMAKRYRFIKSFDREAKIRFKVSFL